MKDNLYKWLICCLLSMAMMPLFAQNGQQSDSLLQLLRVELENNFEKLSKSENPAHYLAYRVENCNEYCISSKFGAIDEKNNSTSSSLVVEVRVGNPAFDNFHAFGETKNERISVQLPLNFNAELIRNLIAAATESAHQRAALDYAKSSAIKALYSDNQDVTYLFNNIGPDGYFEEEPDPNFDEEFFTECVRFHTYGASQQLSSALSKLKYIHKRNYFVNSENAYIVENQDYTYLDLILESNSKDNRPYKISHRYFAFLPSDLPDKHTVNQKVKDMQEKLTGIVGAVAAEEITGPVLFSPKVSSIIMHNVIGHVAESENPLAHTIVSPYNRMTVVDDPSLKTNGKQALSGYYMFDYEGVRGDEAIVFENGSMRDFLSGRTQNANSQQSNGHSRNFTVQSNLIAKSHKPLNHSGLVNELKKILQNRNLSYGLFVADAEILCERGYVVTICPTECYRIFADNRPDQLVRDVKISDFGNHLIYNILFAGDSIGDIAIECEKDGIRQPAHSCAPEILIDNVHSFRNMAGQSPASRKTSAQTEFQDEDSLFELFFKAAENEHNKNIDELRTATDNAPYYSEFLMTDAIKFDVSASCGSVISSNEMEIKSISPRFLLGSDIFNSENYFDGEKQSPSIYRLPQEIDYQNIARELSDISEKEYAKVLAQWRLKNAVANKGKSELHDRSRNYRISERKELNLNNLRFDEIENHIAQLSESFRKADFIEESKIDFAAIVGHAYFWNSENITYIKPVSYLKMRIAANVRNSSGEVIPVEENIYGMTLDVLFTISTTADRETGSPYSEIVNGFIERCKLTAESKRIVGDYFGPVMVTGRAVEQILAKALIEGNDNIMSQRIPVFASDEARNKFVINKLEGKKDNIVTDRNINISASTFGEYDVRGDADGVEVENLELIRKGELLNLVGDCVPTESVQYSNGGRQIAITGSGFKTVPGVCKIIFNFDKKCSEAALESQIVSMAKKKSQRYAYIITDISESTTKEGYCIPTVYRIDVKNAKRRKLVSGAALPITDFSILENISVASGQTKTSNLMITSGKSEGAITRFVTPNSLIFEFLPIIAH